VRGECAVVDTGEVVREAVELLAPPPEVHIEIAGALPTITTERGPLLQVMLNLLSNAIEHGRTDAPRITVGARDADGEIEFSVSDNGPGIPPELHDSIWRIFQAPEPVEPATATGVGLAVVKKIVEARGGRAWVESTPGHGATFRFTWAKGRAGRA
jgi:signal transduction histidine kinase